MNLSRRLQRNGHPTCPRSVSLLGLLVVLALFTGCASLEHNAYVGIGATTTAVELARQAYIDHVNTCACVTTQQFTRVEADYLVYQRSVKVAQDIILQLKASGASNDSALQQALAAVAASSADVIALIETILPPPKTATLKLQLAKVNP